LIYQQARRFQIRRHFGELESGYLKLGDGLPELAPLPAISNGLLHRSAGQIRSRRTYAAAQNPKF
jgi:hypothetical protein